MELSDDDLQQFAEADRRVVDPPIEVQAATSLISLLSGSPARRELQLLAGSYCYADAAS